MLVDYIRVYQEAPARKEVPMSLTPTLGVDLDSTNHQSHLAYPVNNDCPSTHPVPVPKLRQVIRCPANGDPARFRLASGAGFTMHGDFSNAWPVAEMERRVRDCIRPVVKCGVNGTP
ncbi:DUF1996 domain-containing protein [Micromonospora sp. NEAU-HG-1]|nr:DUF1996 domain-containing protein [Micromonospora rubida]